MELLSIKQRFGIIGDDPGLNRALEVASQVAPTDISVLILGESGTGKEVMPQVIHQLSARKHGKYIAVNCGAIPEGTIDSELFGHEKGSFTGAHESRKGYFEEADGGTLFLDEVAELPLQTQVRLLRVLETGEYLRVGSSKVHKTNVRVVAATNENMTQAVQSGKFREDLLYRLSTVPIHLPPLRNRSQDIHLLFRKFVVDFSEKYKMPPIKLTHDAIRVLEAYSWPGNIRQLKNVTEQICIIESERVIDSEVLGRYLTPVQPKLPMVVRKEEDEKLNERELLYKVLFDMKHDLNELKSLVLDLASGRDVSPAQRELLGKYMEDVEEHSSNLPAPVRHEPSVPSRIEPQETSPVYAQPSHSEMNEYQEVEESLSLEDKERELIKKALEKHRGRRKTAAQELGISERTLYRKIKEYDLK